MRSFLFFDKMITPSLITFFFWFLLFVDFLSGLGVMFSMGGYNGITFMSFVAGLISMAIGVVFSRVFCEILIVVFKMNDALQDVRKKLTEAAD